MISQAPSPPDVMEAILVRFALHPLNGYVSVFLSVFDSNTIEAAGGKHWIYSLSLDPIMYYQKVDISFSVFALTVRKGHNELTRRNLDN